MIDKTNNIRETDSAERRRIKRILSCAGRVLLMVLVAATSFLYWGMRYLLDNWSELSMDELVFHFKSNLKGTNPDMIRDGLLRYGLPAALIAAAVMIVYRILRDKEKLRRIYTVFVLAAVAATLFMMKKELDRKVGLTDYIIVHMMHSDTDFIAENYVDPDSVELKFPSRKRNLIYIYLESAEITYADKESGGAFDRNIFPELTALAQKNEDFSGSDPLLNGGIALPGTTWTSGAMFAQSTGLPLKVPIQGNSVKGDNFFPGIAAIGNILEKEGYRQELMIGSSADFGGRRDFYQSHGNYEIKDYDYAVSSGWIPEDYFVFWGYEDEKLFDFAKKELTELAAGGQPFNLTLLTVDTHFEDGFTCRLCRDEFGEQYADVFACSGRQVSDFVNWIREQSFYENTTIVLSGDHPTMDRDFCVGVPEEYQRKTLVSFINPLYDSSSFDSTKRREYDTFDLFPTTLASLNVTIPGGRLGLGVNLFSDVPTLVEQFGARTCQQMLLLPSEFMDSMSGIQITEEMLEEAKSSLRISTGQGGNGETVINVSGLGKHFSYAAIESVEVEFTDKESDRSEIYDAELVIVDPNYTNRYYWSVNFPPGGKTPDDYDVDVYITIGDFSHFKLTD